MTLNQLIRQNPIRAVRTAHPDDAHVGDIGGALGAIRIGVAGPRGFLALLGVLGLCLFAMAGDKEAGGVSTHAQAAQNYGEPRLHADRAGYLVDADELAGDGQDVEEEALDDQPGVADPCPDAAAAHPPSTSHSGDPSWAWWWLLFNWWQ